MWSWWGQAEEPRHAPPRRTVKTKQVHVEVIGGPSTYSAQWVSKQPRISRPRPIERIEGPPRLPSELTTHILILAAHLIDQDGADSSSLLRLALVDRAGHHAIMTTFILPKLKLSGIHQVKCFARDLQLNVLNLQSQVKRVKRLSVRRARERATLEFMRASSLFSGAEEIAQFEKATLEPLKVILSYCSNVEHLSLDMPARVLDQRQDAMIKPALPLGRSLKELVTLLSIYGGDLNEALWGPGSVLLPRWNNLTHLQLHGPRFRMTSLTAIALSQLPSLTHLALIMPLLVQPQTSPTSNSPESTLLNAQVDNARDALGRCNVLQILLDALGHRLHTFLLICHDIENYVGNVQRLGSWIRTLHKRCDGKREQEPASRTTRLVLVTARPRNPLQTTPHPSLYSKWMLQRAERGEQWNWSEDADGVGLDVCEEMKLSYTVESWNIPIVYQRLSPSVEDVIVRELNEIRERADDDTARRWLGIAASNDTDQDNYSSSSDSEEPNGIDNLD